MMRGKWFSLVLAVFAIASPIGPVTSYAAIAIVDNADNSQTPLTPEGTWSNSPNNSGPVAFSQPFTVTTGINSVLVVDLGMRDSSATDSLSVSYGTQTMVQAIQQVSTNGSHEYADIFYLYNPAAGSNMLSINIPNVFEYAVNAYTLSGVDTTIAPVAAGNDSQNGSLTNTANVNVATAGSFASVVDSYRNPPTNAAFTFAASPAGSSVGTSLWFVQPSLNTTVFAGGYVSNLSSGPNMISATAAGGGGNNRNEIATAIFAPYLDFNVGTWTGLGGGTLDTSTNNFALNYKTDPLQQGSLTDVQNNVNATAVSFGDTYSSSGSATAVHNPTITVAVGGISSGLPIAFRNNSVSYTIHSPDSFGITGSTTVELDGTGMVTFTGSHSYTGTTIINSGTLQLGDGTNGHNGWLTGNGGIANNASLVYRPFGSQTVDYTIFGTGILTQAGPGTLTLTNLNNTYSGNTFVTGGTLALTSGLPNSSVVLSSSTVLDLSAAGGISLGSLADAAGSPTGHQVLLGNTTLETGLDNSNTAFSGNISGSGNLMKSGSGTFTLTGSNTYTGSTTINAGTLQIGDGTNGHDGSLATSGITNNTALVYQQFGSQTAGYPISGPGTLTQAGPGTLTLTGPITYTGQTLLTGGTLALNTGAANSSVVLSSNTTLDLRAASNPVVLGSLADAAGSPTGHQVLLGGNTLQTGQDNSSTNFSGAISGNGSLVKQGAGTFTISGVNTYSGSTSVDAGELFTASAASLPSYSSLGSVIVAGGATLAVPAGGTGWSSGQIDDLRSHATWANNTAVLGIDTTNGDFAYSSNITQALALTKLGPNTLTLSGSNTYSGNTTVNAGTLLVPTTASLPGYNTAGSVNVAGGAVLAVQTSGGTTAGWNSGQITSLSNSATWANNTAVLGIDTTNGDFTYGGSITQPLAVTKLRPNTLTLTGSNSYSGLTTISAGTLQMGDGQVGHDGSVAGNILNNSALVYNLHGSQTYAGMINGSGNLTKTGSGTLTLLAPSTYGGSTVVNRGTLNLVSALPLIRDSLMSNSLNTALWTPNTSANIGGATSEVVPTTSGVKLVSRGFLNTTNPYDPTTIGGLEIKGNWQFNSDGDFLQIDTRSTGTPNGSNYGEVSSGIEFFYALGSTAPTIGWKGSDFTTSAATTMGNLNVSTGDKLFFDVVDDGLSNLSFNLMDLTNSTSGSAVATVTSGVATNNYITFHNREQGGDNALLSNVVISNPGQTIGNLPVTTPLTISHGATVDMTNTSQQVASLSSTDGLGSMVLLGSGALTVGDATNTTFDGAISGNGGSLIKQGAGVLNLTGINTYTGGTRVNNGTLLFAQTTAQPSSGVTTVTAGATLALGVGTASAYYHTAALDNLFAGTNPLVISDSASFVGIDTTQGDFTYGSNIPATTLGLTKLGPHTLILTGSNAYSGITTVSSGVLQLGDGTPGHDGVSSTSNVVNNATLVYNLGGSPTYAGQITGSGNVTKTGTGTLTLVNYNAYAGSTVINGGTLRVLGQPPLLADTLKSTTIDLTKWTPINTPVTEGTVTPTVNGVQLYHRGYLNTAQPYDPTALGGLEIKGNYTFLSGGQDFFQLTTRSSGTSGGQFGEVTNGVQFWYIQGNGTPLLQNPDGGGTAANPFSISTLVQTGNLNVSQGDTLFFDAIDSGASGQLSMSLIDLTNSTSGFVSGSITGGAADGNFVTFYDRESNGGPSQLSNVVISQPGVGNGINQLPITTPVSIRNGAKLDLTNDTQTIASLSSTDGHGSMVLLGSGALTVGDSTSTTFDGTISGIGGSLIKQGTGTLVLSGSNTYTGGTDVVGGTLILDSPSALENGTSLTVGADASMIFGAAAAGTPAASAVSAVPEPGTLLLLMVALGSAVIHCRVRRRGSKAV